MVTLENVKGKLEEATSKKANKQMKKAIQKKEEKNEKINSIEKKKRKRQEGISVDTSRTVKSSEAEKITKREGESKRSKPKKEKRKNEGLIGTSNSDECGLEERHAEGRIKAEGESKKKKPKKNKRKNEKQDIALIGKSDPLGTEDEDGFDGQHDDGAVDTEGDADNFQGKTEAVTRDETRKRKSKKSKKNKKEHDTSEDENILEKREEAVNDEVYHISSGEEDCSKGMRKWIMDYHQSRPGLKVLQQRIDEFIVDHEEKLEQERKEREARLAEDGWTVVVHHKGRKKTTDSESGVTVGSVAPVVAESHLDKKKNKEIVGLNFYRFQKRDAQRNEILALQSKFEQDRKRIQQLRAARKFKPY